MTIYDALMDGPCLSLSHAHAHTPCVPAMRLINKQVLQYSIQLVGSLLFLFLLGWQLACVYSAISILFFVGTRLFGNLIRTMQRNVQDVKSDANHVRTPPTPRHADTQPSMMNG